MTLLNFPPSPSLNEVYTANGVAYTWDGTKWTANNANGLDSRFVLKTGDTMSGGLEIGGNLSLNTDGSVLAQNLVGTTVDGTDIGLYTNSSGNTNFCTFGDGRVHIGTNVSTYSQTPNIRLDTTGEGFFQGQILVGGAPASPNIRLNADGSADFIGDIRIGGTLPSAPNIELLASSGTVVAGELGAGQGGGAYLSRGEHAAYAPAPSNFTWRSWDASNSSGNVLTSQIQGDGTMKIGGTLTASGSGDVPNIALNAGGKIETVGEVNSDVWFWSKNNLSGTAGLYLYNFDGNPSRVDDAVVISPTTSQANATCLIEYDGTYNIGGNLDRSTGSFSPNIELNGDGTQKNVGSVLSGSFSSSYAAIFPEGQCWLSTSPSVSANDPSFATQTTGGTQNFGVWKDGTIKIGPTVSESPFEINIELNSDGSASFAGGAATVSSTGDFSTIGTGARFIQYTDGTNETSNPPAQFVRGSTSKTVVYSVMPMGTVNIGNTGLSEGNFAAGSQFIRLRANGTAEKLGGGTWASTSDERLKEAIVDYTSGLSEINQIQPRSYRFIGREETYIGLVAQEVEGTMPEMVTQQDGILPDGTEADDVRMIDSSALTYALVNAVKEMSAEIESLKARLGAAGV